jgi:predicted transposase/invertase (TIGR01784 family)
MSNKNRRTLVSFDWALKSILRQKDNFDILEGFLSDLLDEQITILDLIETESNKENETDKFNRVDLKAKDSKGREIIIEVQYDKESDYLKRVYYGTSKAALENMKVGKKYANVKKIISVSIVYWNLLEHDYLLKGSMKFDSLTTSKEINIKADQNIFAEYYFIQPNWFDDNIKSKIDEWVYMFKYSKIKGDIEATNINKAQDKLDELKMSEEERKAYEEYELNKAINEDVLQTKFKDGRMSERQAMIEAIKGNGMTDDEINKIINFVR